MIAEREFLPPGSTGEDGPGGPQAPPEVPPRSHRRRRSAAALPLPPAPAEMPCDTAGRVAFLAVTPGTDVRTDPAAVPVAEPPAIPFRIGGWTAVSITAALVAVLYVLGMVLTR